MSHTPKKHRVHFALLDKSDQAYIINELVRRLELEIVAEKWIIDTEDTYDVSYSNVELRNFLGDE